MSLLDDISEMRKAISEELHLARCEIRSATSSQVANPSSRVKCHYEVASPQAGQHLDYEGGNGYGYTVFFDEPVTTIAENEVVVIVDSPKSADIGLCIQVQQIPPTGSNGIVGRIDGVKRDA